MKRRQTIAARGEPRGRRADWGALVALAAAVALAFGLSLGGEFVWDDAPLIEQNRLVQDPAGLGEILTSSFWETGDRHDRFRSFFRPLVSLSYAADFAVWGLRPFGFHLTNVLLHLACCWLVFRIALGEGLARVPALAAALLFALHPVHVESVAWISGRTDLLCACFLLASFALYRAGSRGRMSVGRLRVGSWLLYVLALFSKEMAATLPALIFLDQWLRDDATAGRWRRAARTAAPYAAALALYLIARTAAVGLGAPTMYSPDGAGYLATAIFVLARYVTLLLLPAGLDAHYAYPPFESLLTPTVWIAAAMLLLIGWSLRRASLRPGVSFWGLWIFVSLLPVMSFGRFGDVLMADRFLYIPSVGLALLLGRFCQAVLDARHPALHARWTGPAAAALLILLCAATVQRSRVWRDDFTLFSDMLRHSPHSALVRNNLGLSLYERGSFNRAEEEFRLATELAPNYALAHNNLAAALERSGRLELALGHYREALRLAPELSEAGANAGHLLVVLGRPDEGIRLLEQVARSHPSSVAVLYARADALDRAGRRDDAAKLAEQLLELEPDHAAAHYLLGKIRFDRGQREAAASAMRRFLELWGDEGEYAAAARRVVAAAAAPVAPDPGS